MAKIKLLTGYDVPRKARTVATAELATRRGACWEGEMSYDWVGLAVEEGNMTT